MDIESISAHLANVKERISRACIKSGRNTDEIELIAVSKTKPISDILNAAACGHRSFGENKMQELAEKMEAIDNDAIHWHMIGTLQSNKIKYIAKRVDWIHSVSKISHFKEIEKRAATENRTIKTLIQVNISGELQKSGCEPDEISEILDYAKTLVHVSVHGFMGIAALADNPEDIRHEFRNLKHILAKYQYYNGGNIDLSQLSMGMSADLEVAIEEGATMVRVGSDIFGARNYD